AGTISTFPPTMGSTVVDRYVGVLRGCTCTPSATSAAIRSIHGFTAATSIGGSGGSIGPGDHSGGNRSIDQNSPATARSACPRKAWKHARTAWMYSRILGPGGENSAP